MTKGFLDGAGRKFPTVYSSSPILLKILIIFLRLLCCLSGLRDLCSAWVTRCSCRHLLPCLLCYRCNSLFHKVVLSCYWGRAHKVFIEKHLLIASYSRQLHFQWSPACFNLSLSVLHHRLPNQAACCPFTFAWHCWIGGRRFLKVLKWSAAFFPPK